MLSVAQTLAQEGGTGSAVTGNAGAYLSRASFCCCCSCSISLLQFNYKPIKLAGMGPK